MRFPPAPPPEPGLTDSREISRARFIALVEERLAGWTQIIGQLNSMADAAPRGSQRRRALDNAAKELESLMRNARAHTDAVRTGGSDAQWKRYQEQALADLGVMRDRYRHVVQAAE